jgi:hypothetical protein
VGLDILWFKTLTASIGLGIVALGIPIYWFIQKNQKHAE